MFHRLLPPYEAYQGAKSKLQCRVHWLAAEAFGDCAGIIPLGRKRYKLGKMRARTQQFELTEGDHR